MLGPDGYVTPGQLMTYAVQFENEGAGTAFDVYVTDVFDSSLDDSNIVIKNFSLVDWATNTETPATLPYNYDPQSHKLTVLAGTFDSHKGGKFTVELRLKPDAPQGTIVKNFATVYFPTALEETRTNSIISAVPQPASVAYTGSTVAVYSSYAMLAATVTSSGQTLLGKTVNFYIGDSSFTAVTGGAGDASAYPQVDIPPGSYQLSAAFPGDGYYYTSSTQTATLQVLKSETYIADFSTITYSTTPVLAVTMANSKGVQILHQDTEPKTLNLEYLNGTTWTALGQSTLSSGTAVFQFSLPQPVVAAYQLKASFNGDRKYFSSESTATIVFVDTTPPTTELSVKGSPIADGTTSYVLNTDTITIKTEDFGAGLKDTLYTLDLRFSTQTAMVYSVPFALTVGTHTVYYSAVDKAGNQANVKTAYFRVSDADLGPDITPPVTTAVIKGQALSSGATSYLTSADTITLNVVEDGSGLAHIYYSYDTLFSTSTALQYSVPFVLPAGAHALNYASMDNVGNLEALKHINVVVDDTAPVTGFKINGVAISSGAVGYSRVGSTITLAPNDLLVGGIASGVALTTYTIDKFISPDWVGIASGTYSGPISINDEGYYAVNYNSLDKSGNWETPNTRQRYIDGTSPISSVSVKGVLLSSETGAYVNFADSITLTAVDPVSNGVASGKENILYTLDVGFSTSIASTYSVPFTLQAGTHTLYYAALDNAGNFEIPHSILLSVDAQSPVTITALAGLAGANGWYISPVLLTVVSTDALSGVAGVSYSLSLGSVLVSSGNYNGPITAGEEGSYSYTYYAIDKTGNIEPERGGSFKIDLSSPQVTAVSTPSANGYAWNNGVVKVVFSGTDTVSGIASCTSDIQFGVEGSSQSVSGHCTDLAGLSSTVSVTVSIDTTAPVVVSSRTPAANAAGWNNSDVTVSFTCTDALSGVDSCPAGITLSAEGIGISTAAKASDRAGNFTETAVAGVNIDRGLPVSSVELSGVPNNGYYNGAVTVTITSTDTLSGVDKIYYSLDGTSAEYQGPVVVSAEGPHSVRYHAQDKAGNVEAERTLTFNIDVTAPVVSYTVLPQPRINGWNNSAVQVMFTATDTFSGVAICTSTRTVSIEGGSQTVTGSCTDLAGNIAYSTATVSVDTTAPRIAYAASPAAMAGWNNSDVTVSFTCADALSGVESCPAAQTFNAEGVNSSTAASYDFAGNYAEATVAGIKIDRGLPVSTASISGVSLNGYYGSPVVVTITSTDTLSGVAKTVYSLDNGAPAEYQGPVAVSAEGPHSVHYYAQDKAGNTEAAQTLAFNIDLTAPVVSYVVLPQANHNGWNNSITEVVFTATDTFSGVAYCTPSQLVSVEGKEQKVVGSCTDLAGNIAYSTAIVNVDLSSPVTSAALSGVYSGGVYVSSVVVTLSVADGLSGVLETRYSLDSSTSQVYSSSFTVAADGLHTLSFSSTDKAGNTEDTKTSTFTVQLPATDQAPPVTGLQFSATSYFAGGVTFVPVPGGYVGMISTDAMSGVNTVYYKVDPSSAVLSGGLAANTTALFSAYSGQFTLSNGLHVVAYGAVDKAGNYEALKTAEVYFDAAPPATQLSITGYNTTGAAGGIVVSTSHYISFTSTDPVFQGLAAGVKEIRYRLDDGTFTVYNLPFTLGEGEHTLFYNSVDNVENSEPVRSVSVQVGFPAFQTWSRRTFGSHGSGAGQFDLPMGVAVRASGFNIFVTDSNNYRVQKFSMDGRYVSSFGSRGSGPGQFGDAVSVIGGLSGLSGEGAGNTYLYVADPGNYRIQYFDNNNNYYRSVGSHGTGVGQFESLAWVTQSIHTLIATDDVLNRVQIFSGDVAQLIGGSGSGPGQFNRPRGVAARVISSTAAWVYVVDAGNKRIEKFDDAGNFIKEWPSMCDDPYGIAADNLGRVYVSEPAQNAIHVFSQEGAYLGIIRNSGAVTFSAPRGLDTDNIGNLYVADSLNDRVMVMRTASDDSDGPAMPQTPAITARSPYCLEAGFTAVGFSDNSGTASLYDLRYSTLPMTAQADFSAADAPYFHKQPSVAGTDERIRVCGLNPGTNYHFGLDVYNGVGNHSGPVFFSGSTPGEIPVGVMSAAAGMSSSSDTEVGVNNNGPATLADMGQSGSSVALRGLALDASGNLYASQVSPTAYIRRVDSVTNVVTSVAGNFPSAYAGDGGQAAAAQLSGPRGLAFDLQGNLLVVDNNNYTLRKINSATGVITTIAGNGTSGASGNGGAASAALLASPRDVAVDAAGNILISDAGGNNSRIRRINAQTGIITVLAGTGRGYAGDGGLATAAQLNYNSGITFGPNGSADVYVADSGNNRVRKIDGRTGIITTVAGSGSAVSSGDGGLAAAAGINNPMDVEFDPLGNLYISEQGASKVRKVDVYGRITTVAGTGTAGMAGIDGPATSAQLDKPSGLLMNAPAGVLYIGDNYRVYGLGVEPFVSAASTWTIGGQPELAVVSTKTFTLTEVSSASVTERIIAAGQKITPVSRLYRVATADGSGGQAGLTFLFEPALADTTTLALYRFNGVAWSSTAVANQVLTVSTDPAKIRGTALYSESLFGVFGKINDSTPPVVTAAVNGVQLADGANVTITSTDSVTLSATDNMSGVLGIN